MGTSGRWSRTQRKKDVSCYSCKQDTLLRKLFFGGDGESPGLSSCWGNEKGWAELGSSFCDTMCFVPEEHTCTVLLLFSAEYHLHQCAVALPFLWTVVPRILKEQAFWALEFSKYVCKGEGVKKKGDKKNRWRYCIFHHHPSSQLLYPTATLFPSRQQVCWGEVEEDRRREGQFRGLHRKLLIHELWHCKLL